MVIWQEELGIVSKPHQWRKRIKRKTRASTAQSSEKGSTDKSCNDQHPGEDTKDNAGGFASTHLLQGRNTMSSTDDDEERQDTGRQRIVDGQHADSPLEWILAGVDKQLDRTEDDCTKAGSDQRGNGPGCSDL